MPHDSIAPTHPPAARPEPMPRPLRVGLLAALVALTSVAVGATTSPWLVPPYLAAMAWLLMAPAPGRSDVAEDPAEAPSLTVESEPILPEVPPEPIAAEPPPEPPARPKRKRASRAKSKPKPEAPPAAPPTIATWVQVAPGKFVRVEVPAPEPEPIVSTEPDAGETPSEIGETSIPAEPMALSDDPLLDSIEPDYQAEELGPAAVGVQASAWTDAVPDVVEPTSSVLGLVITRLLASVPSDAEAHPCELESVVSDDHAAPAVPPAPQDIPWPAEPEPVAEIEIEAAQPPEPEELPGESAAPLPAVSTPSEPIETRLIEDEPEPSTEQGPIEESPFDGRLVATREGTVRPPMHPRHASPRLAKLRRDPRPKPRRLSGRVGAAPRVVLHRT